MDRTNRWFRRLIILALALNMLAMGAHYWLRFQYERHMASAPGSTVGPVSGISPDGIPVVDSGYGCHTIRYTSIHCPWCAKDQETWQDFDAALRAYGCDSMILAPSAAEFPKNSPASSNQELIMAVPADVAARLDLFATPTTIVADRAWKVAWSKAGILSPGDKEKALSTLERLH
ncbi:MAG: hypothetical protein LAO76_26140 [Acidobacteriia bacterium]|nr:hypothetical protein [Terriglobia bacterium]